MQWSWEVVKQPIQNVYNGTCISHHHILYLLVVDRAASNYTFIVIIIKSIQLVIYLHIISIDSQFTAFTVH